MVIGCESTGKEYKQVANFDLNIKGSSDEDCKTHDDIYESLLDCTIFFVEPVNKDNNRTSVTLRWDHQYHLVIFIFRM